MYLPDKIYVGWVTVATAPELCQKCDYFLKQRMKGMYVMFWNLCLLSIKCKIAVLYWRQSILKVIQAFHTVHIVLLSGVMAQYLHFWSKPLMNLKIFATVHSLMNYTNLNLIDSCQAHLPVQYASYIEFILQKKKTGVVIDSEPHPSRTCKTSFLFAPLTVLVHAGCSAFLFYTPTKLLIRLHIDTKLFNFLNHKYFFYFRYL